jgi:hypothetical protein
MFFLLVFNLGFVLLRAYSYALTSGWTDGLLFSLENPASYGASFAEFMPHKFVSLCSHVIPTPASK